jgi:hypothetical protein
MCCNEPIRTTIWRTIGSLDGEAAGRTLDPEAEMNTAAQPIVRYRVAPGRERMQQLPLAPAGGSVGRPILHLRARKEAGRRQFPEIGRST